MIEQIDLTEMMLKAAQWANISTKNLFIPPFKDLVIYIKLSSNLIVEHSELEMN